MIGKTPVTEIMSKNVVALTITDSLRDIEKLFKRYKIKHLPVISRGAVVGMLSYTDVMRVSNANVTSDGHNVESLIDTGFTVEQVMVKDVICLKSSDTLKEAAEILAKREFHALPVIDEDSDLIGILTTRDLIKYFLKEM